MSVHSTACTYDHSWLKSCGLHCVCQPADGSRLLQAMHPVAQWPLLKKLVADGGCNALSPFLPAERLYVMADVIITLSFSCIHIMQTHTVI